MLPARAPTPTPIEAAATSESIFDRSSAVSEMLSEGLSVDPATTLGAGGMFIETETPLPPGTLLKVRFRLPDAGTVHEIEARVAWIQPPDDAELRRAPGMGIEFTEAAATSTLARSLEH